MKQTTPYIRLSFKQQIVLLLTILLGLFVFYLIISPRVYGSGIINNAIRADSFFISTDKPTDPPHDSGFSVLVDPPPKSIYLDAIAAAEAQKKAEADRTAAQQEKARVEAQIALEKQKEAEASNAVGVHTRQSDYSTNTYGYHSCTWWVKEWKPSTPDTWGNANTWNDNALSDGWTVSDVPVIGAIAQTDAGYLGHVALVIGISGDTVTIREGNYDFNGSVRVREANVSEFRYIY